MNIPAEEVQRSLAICLRSMEEHIPRDEPIYPHVERCVEWLCALPVAHEPGILEIEPLPLEQTITIYDDEAWTQEDFDKMNPKEEIDRLRDSNQKRQHIITRLVKDNYHLKKLLPPNQIGRRTFAATAVKMVEMEHQIDELRQQLWYAELDRDNMALKVNFWQKAYERRGHENSST